MRILPKVLAWLVTIWLAVACTQEGMAGGAGSEAGNGLEVVALGSDGRPVAGARVEIRRTGSDQVAASFVDTTAMDGSAKLQVPDGSWVVLVRRGGFAFWAGTRGSGRVVDTLRPTSVVSGIVEGGAGGRIAALGQGEEGRCDAIGFFRIENLPPGQIPLEFDAAGKSVSSSLELDAGVRAIALAKLDSIPAQMRSLPSDSLIPWFDLPLPGSLPVSALGDSGAFSVVVSLQREVPFGQLWAFSWQADPHHGIRLGWFGEDTVVLEVDGLPYAISGYRLEAGAQQVGLSWDGHRVAVLREGDTIMALTGDHLGQRAGWSAPRFGEVGVRRVDWVAYQRRGLVAEWVRRLSRL